MARQATFATELQLVDFVLNQMGDHRAITEINTLSADKFTAYVSLAYTSCINEVLSLRDWNFAKETYKCNYIDANVHRCKSVWGLVDEAGTWHHVCNVFLREDLEKAHGRHLHWWILSDGNIGTNFDTTNVLHLDTAVFADVIAKPDIRLWGSCFCNLIINALRRPLTAENTQDLSAYKFSMTLDNELFHKAVDEDDLLDNRPWTVKTY